MREPLTAAEANHMANACEAPTRRSAARRSTVLNTLLRVGELCGLTSKDLF